MYTQNLNLAFAGAFFPVPVACDYIIFWSETTPGTSVLQVRINDPTGDPIPLRYRESIKDPSGKKIKRFYVSWAAAAGQVATVICGQDSDLFLTSGRGGAMLLAAPLVAFDAEVLALLAVWTPCFNFLGDQGQNGIVVVYNNGPNAIEFSTTGATIAGRGSPRLASGAQWVFDNPGGQIWYVRSAIANQIAGAATDVQGWHTG